MGFWNFLFPSVKDSLNVEQVETPIRYEDGFESPVREILLALADRFETWTVVREKEGRINYNGVTRTVKLTDNVTNLSITMVKVTLHLTAGNNPPYYKPEEDWLTCAEAKAILNRVREQEVIMDKLKNSAKRSEITKLYKGEK